MIAYMDCPTARTRLEAFVDGELEVAEQVSLEWHLRWCRVCSARVEDLQQIGAALRQTEPEAGTPGEARRAGYVRDAVLAHVRAEREGAWLTRLARAAGDRRLRWPALGATAALLLCILGMSAVLRAATYQTPGSLAGMIAVLANPGSDENPVRLDGRISVPRALAQEEIVSAIPDEDMVLALAAVVTREGRVANFELLESTRARVRRMQAAAWTDDLDAVLDAVGRTRFAPAQGVGGDPVAVSLVWLLTRTTVHGSTDARQNLDPTVVVPAASPATTVPEAPVVEEVPSVDLPMPDFEVEPGAGVGLPAPTRPDIA